MVNEMQCLLTKLGSQNCQGKVKTRSFSETIIIEKVIREYRIPLCDHHATLENFDFLSSREMINAYLSGELSLDGSKEAYRAVE